MNFYKMPDQVFQMDTCSFKKQSNEKKQENKEKQKTSVKIQKYVSRE